MKNEKNGAVRILIFLILRLKQIQALVLSLLSSKLLSCLAELTTR